jgi:hypothetical protein
MLCPLTETKPKKVKKIQKIVKKFRSAIFEGRSNAEELLFFVMNSSECVKASLSA